MEAETLKRIEELSNDACIRADSFADALIPAVVMPSGRKVESLEHLLPAPVFQRASYTTERLEDFCRYVGAEANDATAVFVEPDGSGAQGIIDFGAHNTPAWKRHKANLQMKHTAEFAACLAIHGKPMSQRNIIEWLEDWAHVASGVNANSEALTVPRMISALRRIDIKAKREVGNEEQNFGAKRTAMEEVEATSGDVAMPDIIKIACQIYPCTRQREITLRLSLLTGEDKPTLKARIIGLETINKEVAEEIELEIATRLDGKARVFVGSVSEK